MQPVTEALGLWYQENAREMPWRGISDPYGIWVSEIMLQQTRVDTVRDYYVRFMERFPTLTDLAGAAEEDVLKMWEGLGYYSRARNLLDGARQVVREYGGEMPRTPDGLRRIRGIGPYTSCSIASIAFQVPVPAVDGNVIRVISRLYEIRENPMEPKVRRRIEELAAELVPAERPGDHNQAMMDLGATVCVPGTPDCDRCPLRAMCRARASGAAEELPRLPGAKPPREVKYDLLILTSGERTLLHRRGEKLLQGLWCFPMLEGHRDTAEELAKAAEKRLGFQVSGLRFTEEARHVFTHQIWRMRLYTGAAQTDAAAPEGYEWISLKSLAQLPIPTAMKAALKTLQELARTGLK